jgi:hypothetical protein
LTGIVIRESEHETAKDAKKSSQRARRRRVSFAIFAVFFAPFAVNSSVEPNELRFRSGYDVSLLLRLKGILESDGHVVEHSS